jgi:hypothetical protein
MKIVFTTLLIFVIAITLQAQVPVKKDIIQMLEKSPAPPANVKEAFSKVTTNTDNNGSNCSAAKLFEAIDNEVKAVETEYKSQEKSITSSGMPGLSPENAKKMGDPEMKKKMKGMSKEEKIKMAMEMMKSAPAGGAEMDPPPVRSALDEWQKIYNDIQNDFQKSAAEQQEETKLNEEYQKSHDEISKWEQAEINKLPQISSGEMSAPDPAKVKQVKLKAADKHIALVNKRLEKIRSDWRASVDRTKIKYTPFYKKLIAANYAADTKNFGSKKVLSDAQIIILKEIGSQIERSRKAWEESASWQARKVIIEKQKDN